MPGAPDTTTLDVQADVPLAPFTTLGVGGPARFYLRAGTPEQVVAGAAWAAEQGLELLVLGGGSNLVVSDSGHPGLVLHVDVRGVETRAEGEQVLVRAGAGEPWDALAALAAAQGWQGIECLAGIPGTVGATPIQNVGAYGQEVCDSVLQVEAWDRRAAARCVLNGAECGFSYRNSRFKQDACHIILHVTYRLHPGRRPQVRYAELQRHLARRGHAEASVSEVREAVLEVRRRKSMLLDPGDPNTRSVGSFFMNPIVPAAQHAALGAGVPGYPASAGAIKLPAAWLIEHAGFARGFTRGRVGLSQNHTLAIVNRGGASATDVLALAREIRDGVAARFGITLLPEPTIVGVTL